MAERPLVQVSRKPERLPSYGSSTAAIADSMYRYSACSALTRVTGRHGT